jgi:hypothetical protein
MERYQCTAPAVRQPPSACPHWKKGAGHRLPVIKKDSRRLWFPTLVSCELRRNDRLRFGGEAVPTRGQNDLSLFERSATAPLLLRRGESEAVEPACSRSARRASP